MQKAGQVVVSPQRIDFDLLLRGADQTSFTVKNNSGAGGRLYFDAYVAGSHAGSWDIFFVSSDTSQVAISPENPVSLVSP